MRFFSNFIPLFFVLSLIAATGCDVMPVRRFRPTLNNPFPQLSEVAVVPFINASNNSMVDGREFAELYSNQLQRIPGFNVIPVSTVEQAMKDLKMTYFTGPQDVRKLAKYLQADAVVIGTVNEFSSYQPPKLTISVEWYAQNPYLHPIPAGYGLPWGTPAERQIPDRLVLEAERALAKEQLKTQTPDLPLDEEFYDEEFYDSNLSNGKQQNSVQQIQYLEPQVEEKVHVDPYLQRYKRVQEEAFARQARRAEGHYSRPPKTIVRDNEYQSDKSNFGAVIQSPHEMRDRKSQDDQYQENSEVRQSQDSNIPTLTIVPGVIPPAASGLSFMPGMPVAPGFVAGEPETFPGLPADWPDPRGLIPDTPEMGKPENPTWSDAPVLRHTASYNGNDAEFTRRLQDYETLFVDDRRIGGWQGILRRRADFISVCCRMHIWEMLSSRGGAGKADKVRIEPRNW